MNSGGPGRYRHGSLLGSEEGKVIKIRLCRALLQLPRAAIAATVISLISLASFTTNVHAADECFTLPSGVRFCTPERVGEMKQCVRRMERDRNASPAEHCRRQIVLSCRNMSDEDFRRKHDVQRPRLIDAKASERTRGWNKFCPVGRYQYTRLSQGPIRPSPAKPGKQEQARRAAINEFGGSAYIASLYNGDLIPSLRPTGPCLCEDGSRPVFGFCSGQNGTYKPECAKE